MSRDFTSAEWAETLLRHPRQQLEELERHLEYIRKEAFREGVTAHLRGQSRCPFCEQDAGKLPMHALSLHLMICDEVPEHLGSSKKFPG